VDQALADGDGAASGGIFSGWFRRKPSGS
jgi:hypothetical protein